jgi:hypothetical protein
MCSSVRVELVETILVLQSVKKDPFDKLRANGEKQFPAGHSQQFSC